VAVLIFTVDQGLPDAICILGPKIPFGVNFGGPWDANCWCMLWPFGIFYVHFALFKGHLVYFLSLGIFFSFWYFVQ
jgi:hypothetical protein